MFCSPSGKWPYPQSAPPAIRYSPRVRYLGPDPKFTDMAGKTLAWVDSRAPHCTVKVVWISLKQGATSPTEAEREWAVSRPLGWLLPIGHPQGGLQVQERQGHICRGAILGSAVLKLSAPTPRALLNQVWYRHLFSLLAETLWCYTKHTLCLAARLTVKRSFGFCGSRACWLPKKSAFKVPLDCKFLRVLPKAVKEHG